MNADMQPSPDPVSVMHVVGMVDGHVVVRVLLDDGAHDLRFEPIRAMSCASSMARAVREHRSFSCLALDGSQLAHTPEELLRTSYLFSLLGLIAGFAVNALSCVAGLGGYGVLLLAGCVALLSIALWLVSVVTAWNPFSNVWEVR